MLGLHSRVVYVLVFALSTVGFAQVPALRVVNPRTIPHDFRCIAAGDGQFVAGVGVNDINHPPTDLGALYSSADGATWEKRLSGGFAFVCAAYGGRVFVAQDAQGWVYRSSDGASTWSRVRQERPCWAIVFGAGGFVGLPFQGPIISSVNGITWASTASPLPDYSVSCLAYGNGRFVAVGVPGAAMTSEDGRAWRAVQGPPFRATSITYGAGRFLAAGTRTSFVDRDPVYASSVDGQEWTEIALPAGRGAAFPAAICFAGDHFFGFGQLGSKKASSLWISTDGLAWQVREDGCAGRHELRYRAGCRQPTGAEFLHATTSMFDKLPNRQELAPFPSLMDEQLIAAAVAPGRHPTLASRT